MQDTPGQSFSLGTIPVTHPTVGSPPHIRLELGQDPLTYVAANNSGYMNAVTKRVRQVQEIETYIVSRTTNQPVGYLG